MIRAETQTDLIRVNDGAQGSSPTITASKTGSTTTIYSNGVSIGTINDGNDGATPTITASKSGSTTTIYSNGTAIATVDDGDNGTTPTITATKSGTTTTIYANGVSIATVSDGTNGTNGTNGESIASITNYYLATSASSGITTSSSGWTTTVQTMDSTNQYLWNYEVVVGDKGSTLSTTTPVIIGRYGLNGGTGKGISSITEYYLATSASTGITTSTSGWTTAVQTTDSTNKYLWNYEVVAYTSGNPYTSAPRIIGTYGDSPEITASKSGTTTTIKVDGTTVATVSDGAKGDDGNDASITVSKSGTVATITAVSGDGTTTTATVNDGSVADLDIGGKNLIRYSEIRKGYNEWDTYEDDTFQPSVGKWCRYVGHPIPSITLNGDWDLIRFAFVPNVPIVPEEPPEDL